MDKNTLSNYGWIVIAVLVLAVMIALATPFGSYIEQGVRSTTAGLFDTSEKALNVVGMSAGDGNFENGYSGAGDSSEPEQVEGSATFDDGKTLTWDELKLAENGAKYLYDSSKISDTSIGDSAFSECNTIIDITLPSGMTSIGEAAFFNCVSLLSITTTNSVSSIGDSAFSNCQSLDSIVIPNGVVNINSFLLSDCMFLTNLTIPSGVTNIGESAFSCCERLSNITFMGTKEQWQNISFGFQWDWLVPATVVHCSDGDITL